jgi:hypothetical protein
MLRDRGSLGFDRHETMAIRIVLTSSFQYRWMKAAARYAMQ